LSIYGVYGHPSSDLAAVEGEAIQLSPVSPGAAKFEDQRDGAFDGITMLAPPGVLERRYALAQALRILKPAGRLIALAPKDRGGARLRKELAAFGCAVEESAGRHHRICHVVRPEVPSGLGEAIAAAGPQIPPVLGLWSQPGVFSWDRPDPGTALLLGHLPPLSGRGADFGCGCGMLSLAVLECPQVTHLTLIDIDRRAIEAARRNVGDPRAGFAWRDLRIAEASDTGSLDFAVMNPPFHDGGHEDRALGEAFIRRAAAVVKPDGVCWLVANRHLPYEATLKATFPRSRLVIQADGYKIYEARR
jgi:16S rRNA (guanine1207-N2)-methyltransferase